MGRPMIVESSPLPPIQVTSSLTRRREPLVTQVSGRVSIYVCGVTVYDNSHLGHAMSAVVFDAIRRYLEYRGLIVDYIVNFTDVDDKILNRAAEEGVEFLDVSERYIEAYFRDMDRLGVKRATAYPRATRHIPEMLAMIEKLVARDIAYAVDGDVYFDVRKFEGYGKLSGRKVDELIAGARVEADSRLRQPADFALWKAAKPGEPGWGSPWGRGRPGWHIECSAMSARYLGETFDIHGGGLDLIFPHHENEIAQSEALTGKPLATHWLHNGILNLAGEKMSKSIGNVLGLQLLFQKYGPDAIRHYLLGSHYRSPQNYEEGSLESAARAQERFGNVIERIDRLAAEPAPGAAPEESLALAAHIKSAWKKFHDCMSDDFNTAGALGALFELAGELNRVLQAAEVVGLPADLAFETRTARRTVVELLGVLGFSPAGTTPGSQPAADDASLVDKLVKTLLELRLDAKREKNFALADQIRKRLLEAGIELKDSASQTTWSRKT